MTDSEDSPLAALDLDTAIRLRSALRDIKGKPTKLTPVGIDDLSTLTKMGLIEMRDEISALSRRRTRDRLELKAKDLSEIDVTANEPRGRQRSLEAGGRRTPSRACFVGNKRRDDGKAAEAKRRSGPQPCVPFEDRIGQIEPWAKGEREMKGAQYLAFAPSLPAG
jgi:hypothetical protein